jgi:four helix bundle protein
MATITRFEDLEAWKYARELTKEIFRITRTGPLSRNFRLCDQMRNASVSVMNNIAEGFERGGDKEFHNFLSIAKGSAGEVRSQLYVVLDQGYINSEDFKIILDLTCSISRQVSGLMKYLKRSEFKGSKFKQT